MPSFDEEIAHLKQELFTADEVVQSLKNRMVEMKLQADEADRYAKECKAHIINIMQKSGVITVPVDGHKVTLKDIAAAVVIVDDTLLPPDFLTEKVTYTPDKGLIKQALMDGFNVAGAELKYGVTLQFTPITKR